MNSRDGTADHFARRGWGLSKSFLASPTPQHELSQPPPSPWSQRKERSSMSGCYLEKPGDCVLHYFSCDMLLMCAVHRAKKACSHCHRSWYSPAMVREGDETWLGSLEQEPHKQQSEAGPWFPGWRLGMLEGALVCALASCCLLPLPLHLEEHSLKL